MIRKILNVFGTVVALTAGIALIESQLLVYAFSQSRAFFIPPVGPTPQEIASTLAASEETVVLLSAGDIAHCEARPSLSSAIPTTMNLFGQPTTFEYEKALANETLALAQLWPNAPVLALGDTVYGRGTPIEYEHCFEPTWGQLKPRLLPAPGNHEYGSTAAFGYFDYFGTQAGSDRNGWYALTLQNWLILSLNSEAEAQPGSDQSKWLSQQLRENPDKCVLAFFHRPVYSLKDRGGREHALALFKQLQQAGTTLVLNGHNHFYERTKPLNENGEPVPEGGTVAFTVGTGGRITDASQQKPYTEAAVFEKTGLLKLELRDQDYSWTYVDAVEKTSLDKGSARCNSRRVH
jgi:hypothetical protein